MYQNEVGTIHSGKVAIYAAEYIGIFMQQHASYSSKKDGSNDFRITLTRGTYKDIA